MVQHLSRAALACWLLAALACVHEPFPAPDTPATPGGGAGGNGGAGGGTGGTGGGGTGGGGLAPCDPDSAYFARDIAPVLASNCALSGCHGGGSAADGVDLSSYASVLATADVRPGDPGGSDLLEVLREDDPDKRMPPPPRTPLTDAQIASVRTWIEQGARDNDCDPTGGSGGGGCDTVAVSYAATVAPILARSCVGCHRDPSPQGGVRLATYAQTRVTVDDGRLLASVEHRPGVRAMPLNQPQLPACEIAQLRAWIADGAPDN